MAHIPKVAQSIFGQGRTAQVNVRPVAIPSPLDGAGEALNAAANGLQQVFNGAMKLAHEGQQLALEEAQVAFNDAVTKRMDQEVFSLTGEAAAGSMQVAERILREEESRQLERLSAYGGRASRDFRIFAAKSSTDRLSSAVHYGQGQVSRARISASEAEMQQGLKVYAATGSETARESVMAANARKWETTNNGYMVNADTLAAYDENLKKGFVVLRGEKLQVVDSIQQGDTGVITKERALAIRGQLEGMSNAYEKSRQNLVDQMVASRVDTLLDSGQFDQAQLYMESAMLGAHRPSEQASLLINSRLEVFGRNKIAAEEASVHVQRAFAIGAQDMESLGGRYRTPEVDRAIAEMRTQLAERAAQDTTGMGKRTLELFDLQARARLQQMDANYKADWKSTVDKLMEEGLYKGGKLADRVTRISNMPDGPIKRTLLRKASEEMAVERTQLEESIKKNPELKANRDALINGIKVNIAANNLKIRYKGLDGKEVAVPVDVNNDTEFERYLSTGVFTAAEREILRQYRTAPRIEPPLAATFAVEVLDELGGLEDNKAKGVINFDASNVWKVLPGLEQEIQRILRYRPDIDFRKGSNDMSRQWLKDQIRAYIIAQEYVDPVTKRVIILRNQLKSMSDKEGNVNAAQAFTPERIYELSKTPEQLKMEEEFFRNLYLTSAGPDAETLQRYNYKYDGDKAAARRGLVPIITADDKILYVPKGKAEAHRERENKEKERREKAKKAQEDSKHTTFGLAATGAL